MHKKIEEYVQFKLRNDHTEDSLEKKEEIISNLIERYDDYLKRTNDEEQSYIETIKTIGDFIDEEDEEINYRPELSEMFLVSASVLAIISLLAVFLNSLVGLIIVGISISLYSVGALYLYQKSKFYETVEFNVRKYRLFLDKTFSYMKTNFTFWAITLTLVITQLIYQFLLWIVAVTTVANYTAGEIPDITTTDDIWYVYVFVVLGFIITFSIIGSFFIVLYRRLMKKYKELSGNSDIQSVGEKAKTFLGNKQTSKSNIFKSKWLYPSLNVIILILLLVDIDTTASYVTQDLVGTVNMVNTISITLVTLYLALNITYFLQVLKNHFILPIFNVVVSIGIITMWFTVEEVSLTRSFQGGIYFVTGIVFLLLLLFDFLVNRKRK